jgi:DNA-binding transcriptional LysR family regulator
MVADCRNVLNRVGALAEHARALRQGDIKVMRIAASALTIEGLLSTFLNGNSECCHGIKVKLIEAHASEHVGMLERGEVDISVNVVNNLRVDDDLFGIYALPAFHVIAACAPGYKIEAAESIDIRKVVRHPLLLLSKEFATRAVFDSACQLANVQPNALVESIGAHTLLAMAEGGQGVAIIPSVLQAERWSARTMRVTHRGQLLKITVGVLWDRRRMSASNGELCGRMLSEHVSKTFPNGAPVSRSGGPSRAN